MSLVGTRGWRFGSVAALLAAGLGGGGAGCVVDLGDESSGSGVDAGSSGTPDASGGGPGDPDGAPSGDVDGGGPGRPDGGALPASCDDYPHESVVDVEDADGLEVALAAAAPGQLIRLAPGTYGGRFSATASGAAAQPITLCGPRAAVLDGGSGGNTLHLEASHWVVAGITIRGGQKGLLLDRASDNLLADLLVHGTEHEAVHFRSGSSDNVLRASEVRDTGTRSAGFGEGVYIGSAESNWCDFDPGCGPDRSDRNQVLDCTIANTAAESIDIKEGSAAGVIRGNHFDGSGMSGDNFADSWLDVKGNGYLIEANAGTDALLDGFQVHVAIDGWGNDTVFRDNTAAVNGPGVGFRIQNGATGTVVACDNEVSGAGEGFGNVECQ
jgi:hypothetical protein